ncbi:MAG: molecular chaperone DnaJ [Ardenticatenia bacterium]|nr:molecular chaperone DnaJ [Ardenticatenia bacterium]
MSAKRDYYEILGISRNATKEEIRRAYRRLARQYHPDVNKSPEAEERFKEINEAYEVLSDDEKRAMYDRFGHAGPQAGFGFGSGVGIDLGDLFEEFFGFGRRTWAQRRGPMRGGDIKVALTISFEEAVRGTVKEIEVSRLELCPECGGSGAAVGSSPVRCGRCGGTGEVRMARQSIFGQVIISDTCPACRGEGEVVQTPCRRCRGERRVRVKRRLEVTVPPGVDDGMRIRLTGEGEHGLHGGPPGNLYVDVRVLPHEYFRRQGNDILLDVEINVAQAALGDEIEIITVDGPTTLNIPPGTQTGHVFRLRGKGVPHVRNPEVRGDQLVTVFVAVPTNLTPEQRRLFQELARTLGKEVIPQRQKGLFDRLRDALNL